MKITWADAAKRDRRTLIQFVAQDSIANAIGLDDRIDEAVDQLGEFPTSGRAGRFGGTRELVVSRTPYVAVYAVEQDEVVILRLLHGAQQWPPADRV